MATFNRTSSSRGPSPDKRHGKPSTGEGSAGKPRSFLLHSLLGLNLSFLVLFVVFTGTVATVSHEIDWLIDSRIRATPFHGPLPWERMAESVQSRFPNSRLSGAEAGPDELIPWMSLPFAARFHIAHPDGTEQTVFIDPASLQITGVRSGIDFPYFMRQLHYCMFLYPQAFFLVSIVSFLLIGSLITGLAIHKKFWSGFFQWPRRKKGIRIFLGDLHRLVAVWSTWFILVMALTGVWYFAEELLWRAGVPLYDDDSPQLSENDLRNRGPEAEVAMSLETLLDHARKAMPGLQVRSVFWGSPPLGAVHVSGQTGAWWTRDRASQVSLNPYTGAVLRVRRAENLNAFWRFSHMADPIHFGSLGGLPTKLIWFVCGLGLCTLAITGVLVFTKRAEHAVREWSGAHRSAPPWLWWLGSWKWINVAILFVPVVAFAWNALFQN
ncbi:PepSY-associated TM helix domain-containing protein [Nitrospina watsonii]|uniref:PepSY domain-containing protein n=1 Tax=Nitrospina watsonii TaxID=1323948 RepID=A0ABN8W1T1_9BACT|nr:PepSY-associated TM helix domain-containing protein [Nitrospina watsonii]CAI2718816.1 membrane protein of unknown function [Nitrospina watsonii]